MDLDILIRIKAYIKNKIILKIKKPSFKININILNFFPVYITTNGKNTWVWQLWHSIKDKFVSSHLSYIFVVENKKPVFSKVLLSPISRLLDLFYFHSWNILCFYYKVLVSPDWLVGYINILLASKIFMWMCCFFRCF